MTKIDVAEQIYYIFCCKSKFVKYCGVGGTACKMVVITGIVVYFTILHWHNIGLFT